MSAERDNSWWFSPYLQVPPWSGLAMEAAALARLRADGRPEVAPTGYMAVIAAVTGPVALRGWGFTFAAPVGWGCALGLRNMDASGEGYLVGGVGQIRSTAFAGKRMAVAARGIDGVAWRYITTRSLQYGQTMDWAAARALARDGVWVRRQAWGDDLTRRVRFSAGGGTTRAVLVTSDAVRANVVVPTEDFGVGEWGATDWKVYGDTVITDSRVRVSLRDLVVEMEGVVGESFETETGENARDVAVRQYSLMMSVEAAERLVDTQLSFYYRNIGLYADWVRDPTTPGGGGGGVGDDDWPPITDNPPVSPTGDFVKMLRSGYEVWAPVAPMTCPLI